MNKIYLSKLTILCNHDQVPPFMWKRASWRFVTIYDVAHNPMLRALYVNRFTYYDLQVY